MTITYFYNRVYRHAIVLEEQGMPSDMETVIFWDCEWHAKWAMALKGIYDA